MIDLATIAGLLERDHGLAAYCPLCDPRAVLPLAQMVAEGKRLMHLPISVLCRRCGEVGRLQVHPLMTTWSGSAWMMQ